MKFLVGLLLLVSSMFVQAQGLSKELEDVVKQKCTQGCAVLSAEEIEQLNLAIAQLANDAFQKGKASEKGSCRKIGNQT